MVSSLQSVHRDDKPCLGGPLPGGFPASLLYVLIVSPARVVPSTFMPLPSRNTSAGPPVVLDTALLPVPSCPDLTSQDPVLRRQIFVV